jgi:hypothetical protein
MNSKDRMGLILEKLNAVKVESMDFEKFVKYLDSVHNRIVNLRNVLFSKGWASKPVEEAFVKCTVINIDKLGEGNYGCIVFKPEGIFYYGSLGDKYLSFKNYRKIHDSDGVIADNIKLIPIDEVNAADIETIEQYIDDYVECIKRLLKA